MTEILNIAIKNGANIRAVKYKIILQKWTHQELWNFKKDLKKVKID